MRSQAALSLRFEAIVLLLLLRQSLNNSNGGKRLLGQRRQETRAYTCLTRGHLDSVCVTKDRPKQERSHGEGNKGKLPIEPEHQDKHADQQKHVTSENYQAVGNQILNGLNIRS